MVVGEGGIHLLKGLAAEQLIESEICHGMPAGLGRSGTAAFKNHLRLNIPGGDGMAFEKFNGQERNLLYPFHMGRPLAEAVGILSVEGVMSILVLKNLQSQLLKTAGIRR